MTEKELFIECIPEMAEMAMEIQKMGPEQYEGFKKEYLEEVGASCPVALGFMEKVYSVIECCLAE